MPRKGTSHYTATMTLCVCIGSKQRVSVFNQGYTYSNLNKLYVVRYSPIELGWQLNVALKAVLRRWNE